MYGGAAAALQPKAWQSFLEALAPAERREPLPAYYRRLTSPDTAVRDAAVRSLDFVQSRIQVFTGCYKDSYLVFTLGLRPLTTYIRRLTSSDAAVRDAAVR